jgi:hypothetical protein
MRLSLFGVILILLYAATFAAVALLLVEGASYYLTPLLHRAHHAGYWLWKPGGRIGHTLGTVGSAMMILMLGYSARKRLSLLRGWGPVSHWLDLHIYLGISGPLFVVLHSSFKVQGLVALSFWSMVAVALSGVAGRFLYLQVPRTRAGEEIALDELRRRDQVLTDRLKTQFALEPARLARLEALGATTGGPPTSLRLLSEMIFGPARERSEVRAFVRECRGRVPAQLLHELGTVAHEKAATHRRVLLWYWAHDLFHYWHVFHKPFAVVMYVFMAVHVGVALYTGYGW